MHSEKAFFIRELTRLIDTQINSVRRELQNLVEGGVIKEVSMSGEQDDMIPLGRGAKKVKILAKEKQPKKFFQVNQEFVLFNELRALFAKSPRLLQKALEKEFENLGNVEYAVLTGFFVDRDDTPVDLLIVGNILRSRLAKLIHTFEKEIEHEINYSTMTLEEFTYRKSIIDRFLFTILEGKKIVIVDSIAQS